MQEFGVYRVFKQRGVAGDDGQARWRDKVTALVFDRVVADYGSFGNVHIAIDDCLADAAVAADVDVRKDDAGVDVGIGVDAHILGEDGV